MQHLDGHGARLGELGLDVAEGAGNAETTPRAMAGARRKDRIADRRCQTRRVAAADAAIDGGFKNLLDPCLHVHAGLPARVSILIVIL
jgi:hypothetical protein